ALRALGLVVLDAELLGGGVLDEGVGDRTRVVRAVVAVGEVHARAQAGLLLQARAEVRDGLDAVFGLGGFEAEGEFCLGFVFRLVGACRGGVEGGAQYRAGCEHAREARAREDCDPDLRRRAFVHGPTSQHSGGRGGVRSFLPSALAAVLAASTRAAGAARPPAAGGPEAAA